MNKSALICEDSLTTSTCIKSMFKNLGFESDIAQSAEDALILLKTKKYDVLTLDVILPDKNGLELLKEIKKDENIEKMPIIVISATKKESHDGDFEDDIVYWIEKSFDVKELEKTLESAILKKKKAEILHVENDEDLLSLVEITLSDIANVTKSTNLQDAKTAIESKLFDLIILDYVFPEGTSDKLIPVIKASINKSAKIVMFSAYEENKILANYVDNIIIKSSVSYEEFKQCVEKLMPPVEEV